MEKSELDQLLHGQTQPGKEAKEATKEGFLTTFVCVAFLP